MEDLTLLHPLWLIPAAVLLVLAFVLRTSSEQDDWHKLILPSVLSYLRKSKTRQRQRVNWNLLAAGICALALSTPATRIDTGNTLVHSSSWFILMDVSRSMTTTDIAPSRLSAARNTLLQLSQNAGSRPVGLVVYAGDAYLASPPALDKRHLEEIATLLQHGVVPQEGSNLTRALSLVTSAISDGQLIDGRVFLLTDSGGVNNTAQAAARFLHAQGQQLDVIVYGSTEGNSNVSVDLEQVKAIAEAGGGVLTFASKFGEVDLNTLKLQSSARGDLVSAGFASLSWHNQSHWLLLLLLPVLIQLFRSTAWP